MLADYYQGYEDGMKQRAEDIIRIFNEIEDMGRGFRLDGLDIREYLMRRMYVSEELWPTLLEGRKMMTQEEVDKLPQA